MSSTKRECARLEEALRPMARRRPKSSARLLLNGSRRSGLFAQHADQLAH
jgi:hypothetical protein